MSVEADTLRDERGSMADAPPVHAVLVQLDTTSDTKLAKQVRTAAGRKPTFDNIAFGKHFIRFDLPERGAVADIARRIRALGKQVKVKLALAVPGREVITAKKSAATKMVAKKKSASEKVTKKR